MSSGSQPFFRTYKAAGTINPFRAVKFSGDNKTVVQAGAGDEGCGISQNQDVVTTGQAIEVAMPGAGCRWTTGATLAGPGPYLCKSDANGKAVKASDTDFAFGFIYDGGADAEIHEGYVMPQFAGATQS